MAREILVTRTRRDTLTIFIAQRIHNIVQPISALLIIYRTDLLHLTMYTQHSIKYWNTAPEERKKFRRHPFILLSNASLASQGSPSEQRWPSSPNVYTTSVKSPFFEDDLAMLQSIETKLSGSSSISSYESSHQIPECMARQTKKVSFDTVEIREHPRILGDNPVPKYGPSLSIGWFKAKQGRHMKYTVDEFEAERSRTRRPKNQSLVLSCKDRKRILKEETSVSPKAIRTARKEATFIRKSRRSNTLWWHREMEQAAIIFESLTKPFWEFLHDGALSEWEFRELMAAASRAERAKRLQQAE